MKYTLVVFKSRFATIRFANILKTNNIPVAIINTPKEIGGACGICVKFLSDYYSKIKSFYFGPELQNQFYKIFECFDFDGRLFFTQMQ